jgi:hypothetical protein
VTFCADWLRWHTPCASALRRAQVVLAEGGTHIVTVHADSDETICEDTCVYAYDGLVSDR